MPNNHEVFLNTSQLIWLLNHFFLWGGIVRNASQAKPIDSKLGFRFGVYNFFVHLKKVLEVSLS